MKLWKYTNGTGHLIMSLFLGTVGLVLTILPSTDATTKGVGVSLILSVAGAWLVPGAAKQVAYSVQQVTQPLHDAPQSIQHEENTHV